MLELRRGLYPHLQEWEIRQEEIDLTDHTLGEGAYATVRGGIWLNGVAAVKVYRPKPTQGAQYTINNTVICVH